MKFISILTALSLIFIFSCDEDSPPNSNIPHEDTGGSDGGSSSGGGTGGGLELEIDYSICNNCIWIQEDCNGNWIVGYNTEHTIGGFQFDVDGVTINSAYGGDAETSGFSLSVGGERVIGFSLSGLGIPPGSGTLCLLDITGTPNNILEEDIIFSNTSAEALNISCYNQVIYCYSASLEQTGKTQLNIFFDTITGLEIGDEIGIFDSNAIINYNDCSAQKGELLVGSGIWLGTQLAIVSIASIDNCSLGGTQLSGFVNGNPLIIKIYRHSTGLEYSTEVSWGDNSGYFGEDPAINFINNITLNNNLTKGS